MRDLLQHVQISLADHSLLKAGHRVLLAVSGGVDSMVLLHVLARLARRNHWELAVAHLNHRLRGSHAATDARFVAAACRHLGFRCFLHAEDVARHAKARGISVEMAGRERRHHFLAKVGREWRADRVALAHHADDQAELFFLRIMRGAGGRGLAGMRWVAPSPADPGVTLVRPLLDVRRAEIEDYARSHRIRHREDGSNQTTDVLRNRIRLRLMPLLLQDFQPSLVPALSRTMEVLAAEGDCLDELAAAWTATRRPAWSRLHRALQRRVICRQLIDLGVEPTFERVEPIRRRAGQRVSLGGDRWLRRDQNGRVFCESGGPEAFSDEQLEVHLGRGQGSARFAGHRFTWSHRPHCSPLVRTSRASPGREQFDADQVGDRIVLRHWRPGDRFAPLGMARPKKLQDLFVNQKIARAERHRLVVAVGANGEVFWVQGLRISERFKLTRTTRRRLVWAWSPETKAQIDGVD